MVVDWVFDLVGFEFNIYCWGEIYFVEQQVVFYFDLCKMKNMD